MKISQRLRLARRHAGLSQRALAEAVGVARSAVSHWEAGSQPSAANLEQVAVVTQVRFEWLATGRGAMALSAQTRMDSIPAAHGLLIEDPQEVQLLESIRSMNATARVTMYELANQLAQRKAKPRVARHRAGNGAEKPR